LSSAVLRFEGHGRYVLKFPRAQRAVTKGQVAVFYKGSVCLGGGFIC